MKKRNGAGWKERERERAGTLPKAGCNQEGIKKGPEKNEKEAHTQQTKQIRQLKVRDERAVDIL